MFRRPLDQQLRAHDRGRSVIVENIDQPPQGPGLGYRVVVDEVQRPAWTEVIPRPVDTQIVGGRKAQRIRRLDDMDSFVFLDDFGQCFVAPVEDDDDV